MSFGFRADKERWPKPNVRELLAVDLLEVSIVQAFPAYAATSVQARSRYEGPIARARQRWMETL